MSTRASIAIKNDNKTVWVYHHTDGYPGYLGKKIDKFLKKIYHKPKWYNEDIATDLIKEGIDDDNSFRLINDLTGDSEYLYEIDCNTKELKTFEIDLETNNKTLISTAEYSILK